LAHRDAAVLASGLIQWSEATMFWWTWMWHGGLALLALGVLVVGWYRLRAA